MIRPWLVALVATGLAAACREAPPTVASPHRVLAATASQTSTHNPTWWAKYEQLLANGAVSGGASLGSVAVGANVDASNECGPQSETYIALDPLAPGTLTAGSNEIFRLPMRAYFSSDGGSRWGAVDVPLPPPLAGTNDTRFGSDPSVAFDTRGDAFYSFIVVFFGAGNGINGTEMAVARSSDGGRSWPVLTQFSFESGQNHFNDKPMITSDQSPTSPFRDDVYAAWDAASGGSTGGGIRVAHSTDHGASFAVTRADNPSGPGRSIGAVPFLAPNGTVYVAWNDYVANVIAFNRSSDGAVTWDAERTVAPKSIAFDIAIPAESFRRALVYPACDADRSSGAHRGRLYCAWMDLDASGHTGIRLAFSDDGGTTWSAPAPVGHQGAATDRFNQWLSVDQITGNVTVSYYDAAGYTTDVWFSRSADGGLTWAPDVRITTASSNEHDCGGLFPCPGIDYGNQYGDYEGLVSFAGAAHPIWTDSRDNLVPSAGCPPLNLTMEEVFTATVSY